MPKYTLFEIAIRLICAAVMGGVIGAERANRHQAAGLRTFSLVCVGSALAQIVDTQMVAQFGMGDPVRLAQGVISGIGFLGVGTIIVTRENHIKGLTTAATLWTTAVLGICVGSGFVWESAFAFVLIFGIVKFLSYVSKYLEQYSREIDLVIEVENQEAAGILLDYIQEKGCRILLLEKEPHSEYMEIHLELDFGGRMEHGRFIDELSRIEHVNFVQENR